MKIERFRKTALALALAGACGAAQAGIVVDDWTLDVNAVLGNGVVLTGIDEILFNADVRAVTNDANGNGIPDPGETFETAGYGIVTQFNNDFSGIVTAPGLNDPTHPFGWEMSFYFEAGGVFTGVSGSNVNFVHNNVGTLSLYLDDITDGSKAAPGSGPGSYTDGTLVATFTLMPGLGGSLNLATADGSDDSMWLIDLAGTLAGVFFDSLGVDLGTQEDTKLSVDSNFDSDPLNTGLFSYFSPLFESAADHTGGTHYGPAAHTPIDFLAKEDGSIRVIPEPGMVGLLGLGLLGAALAGRRRRREDA